MKAGDLIAVSGNLYEYIGYEEEIHKVYDVEIDEKGILTVYGVKSFSDEELSNRGIHLTEQQWIGLTEYFIRQEYDLTEEEISKTAEDIVCRCFPQSRIPLVEELPNYIAIYMNR